MSSIWEGSLVRLRAVEPSDAEAHFRWNQDSEMARRLDYIRLPQSRKATERWAESASLRKHSGDDFHFEVETLGGELVGSVAAHHCDQRNGTFQIGVAIMAEHQRRGFAREAVTLLMNYYFRELRYQKAMVFVASFNEASLRLCERLRFQQEGSLRRMIYTDGRFFDEIVFGMTVEEFAASLLPDRDHGST